ncbi:MAG: ribonuclease P [Candidatus Altiarchaeales archaeon]|nr:ribonuclease P [Candidatus Altiarchaeales archaeon]MBD3416834.1 ribonuclease P [Candidatus Altiarchaeales archaeon]
MARPRDKADQKKIALERIRILFDQAGELAADGDYDSATSRVRQAHIIGLRCNVRMPRELKMRYCRRCKSYLASNNSRKRLNSREKRLEVKCLRCGYVSYLPYAREKNPNR